MSSTILDVKYRLLTWLNYRNVNPKGSKLENASQDHPAQSGDLFDAMSDITVFMNVWKRNHLVEQIEALLAQSYPPREIWLLQCANYVDTKPVIRKYPFIRSISSSVNLKYFGRFSLANFVQSKYLFILDDDVIPSPDWLVNCRSLCEQKNVIVASAGRIIPKHDLRPEALHNVDKYFIADVDGRYTFNYCQQDVQVDFGCNSWFVKSNWIQDFWGIPPYSFETGEDIHLSASAWISKGIQTIVPMQTDAQNTGNLKKEYGQDGVASWRSKEFLPQREAILNYLIKQKGWKPILWQD